MTITRRSFVKWLSATAGISAMPGCTTTRGGGAGRVVVVGGGYGGATAAKYIKLWAPDIDVTLIERGSNFVSCPISNLVIGGSARMKDITIGYDGLRRRGIRIMHDEAIEIEPVRRRVRLAGGTTVHYDRLIVSPGIDFMYDQIPALKNPAAQSRIPHAWKAGPQTVALRRQLEAMPDGGVYALHIPASPYRCPPGPYERACQVAHYFRMHKPKSKVLVLDSNPDIQSKKGLFMAAWNRMYKGIIEYRPNSEILDVDVKTMTAKLQFEDVRADVLNVVPPQKAGAIAERTGLITTNRRWCGVDWLTLQSLVHRDIHLLGDVTLSAPAMPKSGHMANQHGKVCAAAVIALLAGRTVNPSPLMINTCYSFVDDKNVVHVVSVHRYAAREKTMLPVRGSGGLSPEASELEGAYAWGWARNIWADALA